MVSSHSQGLLIALTDFVERKRGWRKLAASLEGNVAAGAPRATLLGKGLFFRVWKSIRGYGYRETLARTSTKYILSPVAGPGGRR